MAWFKITSIKAFLVCAAALITFSYGGLAGFALPVQRSLVMILMAAVITLMPRAVSVWSYFCLALLAVLVIDPFASLTLVFGCPFRRLAA